jgi:hypothetical protein
MQLLMGRFRISGSGPAGDFLCFFLSSFTDPPIVADRSSPSRWLPAPFASSSRAAAPRFVGGFGLGFSPPEPQAARSPTDLLVAAEGDQAIARFILVLLFPLVRHADRSGEVAADEHLISRGFF